MATNRAGGTHPNSVARDETVTQSLARLDMIARLMDSAVTLPGTNVTLGFDAALGLIPVIGDLIAGAVSAYIIWEAKQLGVSKFLIARMSANATLDTVLGSIPILGDVFDIAYKANCKNVALLMAHIEKHGLGEAKTIEAEYRRV